MAVKKRRRGVGGGSSPSMTDDVEAGSDSAQPSLLLYSVHVVWLEQALIGSTVQSEPKVPKLRSLCGSSFRSQDDANSHGCCIHCSQT